MWRTALRPRWLALLALVLVLASGMAWLGTWQLERAREQGGSAQRTRLERAPVELTVLFGPRQPFPADGLDRPIRVQGSWEPDRQLLLPDRQREGESGYWILTPLRLDDGSVVGVVRGFAADESTARDSASALPVVPVEITGILRPGEPSDPRPPGEPSPLPSGQLARIDPVELIEVWDGPLFTGYVIASPAVGRDLLPVPLVSDRSNLALQNLSYAVQWWLFAGFGLWLWWRLVRDDHRGVLGGRRHDGEGGQADGDPPRPTPRPEPAGPAGRMAP